MQTSWVFHSMGHEIHNAQTYNFLKVLYQYLSGITISGEAPIKFIMQTYLVIPINIFPLLRPCLPFATPMSLSVIICNHGESIHFISRDH